MPPIKPSGSFAALLLSAAVIVTGPARAAPPAIGGAFTNLGPQVTAATIQGSAFVHPGGEASETLLYTVARGEPGHLLAYHLDSPEPVLDLPLPGRTDGAWNVAVSSDNFLYLPGADAHLYRLRPGSSAVEDLGKTLPSETLIWDLCAGRDGKIFGGTYPGGKVFCYDPKAGFSDPGGGSLVAGENYTRAVAYHADADALYAGIGAHAHLIALDLRGGGKSELLGEQTQGEEAVYSLGLVPDETNGDHLLCWITNANRTVVYNLRSRRIERTLGSVSVKTAVKAPGSSLLYYSDGLRLFCVDLADPGSRPDDLARCIGANAMSFRSDGSLLVLTRYAQLLTYNPQTRKATSLSLDIPPQPIPIQSIATGPDGRIWTGGFLAGGAAAYDPRTNKTEHFRGLSQSEAIATLDGQLYFGVYPHGRLYACDLAKPWDGAKGNPRQIIVHNPPAVAPKSSAPNSSIPGQSRPVALCPVPALHSLFIGTVPEYGELGGHLLDYSASTDTLTDRGEVVAGQSIISLAYLNDTIFAGSSITGGLGTPVQAHEARLLAWDPVKQQKLYDLVPVPGATAITALTAGPDRLLWGIANGTLFRFNPASRRVESTNKLLDLDYASRHYNVWRDAFVVVHPNGRVYLTLDGKLYVLDPTAGALIALHDHADMLALGPDGSLYFRDGINLWRFTP